MNQGVFDDIVVGNGLLGAAMALELIRLKRRVCLIGAAHGADGRLFSGHHDDSRMLRLYHADVYWEEMTRLNLALMQTIDAHSTTPYFTPATVRFRGLDQPDRVSSLRSRFSSGNALLQGFDLEDEVGGIINPLHYIAAMNWQAERSGLVRHRAAVRAVNQTAGGCEVETDQGSFTGNRILHASGFHTAASIDTLQVAAKVVLFARRPRVESGPAECFIDARPGKAIFSDVYGFCDYKRDAESALTKFGFSEAQPILLQSQQIPDWFNGGYLQHPLLADMQEWIHQWYGGFTEELRIQPCAFSITPDRRPGLWQHGSQYWLAGCNGMAAKCCQAVARSALVTLQPTDFPDFPPSLQLPVRHHA